MIMLLSRSVDRRITFDVDTSATSSVVSGDPSSLQGALLNLGVNAADAMPEGGVLRFATKNITIDEGRSGGSAGELLSGHYVEIAVIDSGAGIKPELLSRIFEPFFTTKAENKGTGLGLAAVYGCVTGHQGAIDIESELGRGRRSRYSSRSPSPP